MSAFAATYVGGGGGGGGGGSRMDVHTIQSIDEADMNFWQRLQHKYPCCLLNMAVNAFCPTREFIIMSVC
jgi:hypothetical protein